MRAHATPSATRPARSGKKAHRTLAALAAFLMLAGCNQAGEGLGSAMLAGYDAASDSAATPEDQQKAIEHWGRKFSENPRDLDSAIAYAQSLKAAGEKTQALAVLQQASLIHGRERRLASEYGRLALELDQISVAKPLLEAADDPANPDWRIVLARGTVLAKEGRYKEAIPYYERALALKPDHPSVMSNLALAYTMSGEAAKGEDLLRRASASNEASAKVRQNLALVLALQGKYDEAAKVGSVDLPDEKVQANVDAVRAIADADAPKSEAAPAIAKSGPQRPPPGISNAWLTEIVEAPPARPAAKRTATRTAESRPRPPAGPKPETTHLAAGTLGALVNAEAEATGTRTAQTASVSGETADGQSAYGLAFERAAAETLGCLRQNGQC